MSADEGTRVCPATETHPIDGRLYRRCRFAPHPEGGHEWLAEWLPRLETGK